MSAGNLFEDVPRALEAERFDVILDTPGLRVERIVSTGHATPPGQWWDQDRDEWVVLLRGSAALAFEDAAEVLTLGPGDWVLIPAHRRHRVEWTDAREPTVWLALHYARATAP
jgi:cupin 2 domain-containing protein